MHAQAACVDKQPWIPHKLYLVGIEKSRLRSAESANLDKKCKWGLNFP